MAGQHTCRLPCASIRFMGQAVGPSVWCLERREFAIYGFASPEDGSNPAHNQVRVRRQCKRITG